MEFFYEIIEIFQILLKFWGKCDIIEKNEKGDP